MYMYVGIYVYMCVYMYMYEYNLCPKAPENIVVAGKMFKINAK